MGTEGFDMEALNKRILEFLKLDLPYFCDACQIEFHIPTCPVCRSDINQRVCNGKKEYGHEWAIKDWLEENITETSLELFDVAFNEYLEEEEHPPTVLGQGFETARQFLDACGGYEDARDRWAESDGQFLLLYSPDRAIYDIDDIEAELEAQIECLSEEEYPLAQTPVVTWDIQTGLRNNVETEITLEPNSSLTIEHLRHIRQAMQDNDNFFVRSTTDADSNGMNIAGTDIFWNPYSSEAVAQRQEIMNEFTGGDVNITTTAATETVEVADRDPRAFMERF